MSIRDIIQDVASRNGLTPADLTGRSRSRKITKVRQEAMWRARQVKWPSGNHRYSFPHIGRALNRDHTTVMFGAAAHAERYVNLHRHLPSTVVCDHQQAPNHGRLST